jgi:ATP-binding cassette subfamily B protein
VQIADGLEILRAAGPFGLLDEPERRWLAERMTTRVLTLGTAVFERGEDADAAYFVVSGRARVVGTDAAGNEVSLGVLRRGDHFGEAALLLGGERTATVRAAEDLVVLRLEGKAFRDLLAAHPGIRVVLERSLRDLGVQNFLKQFTTLGPVPTAVLRDIVRDLEPVSAPAGTPVVREGEAGDRFFIVRSGALEVVKREGDEDHVVGYLGPGECFGELALLTGSPRAASVVARADSEVFALSRDAFDRALAASPELRGRLERIATSYGRRPVEPLEHPEVVVPPGEAPAEPGEPELEAVLGPPGPRWRRLLRLFPFVAQHDQTDCAAACLAMVTRFYGVPIGVARLRDLANVDRDGASLWSLSHAAEALGFHSRGLQLAYDGLMAIATPAIVHWEGFHYVVLYEARPGGVVLGDPALGIRRLPVDEFRRGWTGRALELVPTPALRKAEKARGSIARFASIVRPHLPLVLEVILASLLLNLFALGLPLFTQVILDRVIVHGSVDLLDMLLAGMLAVAIFQAATTAVRRLLLIHISTRADLRLVGDFLRHVMSLPLRFFDLRRVGDVLSRVSENEKVRAAMVGTIPGVVLDTCLALGYLVLLAYYNVRLTLVVCAVIPAFVLLMVAFTPPILRNRREQFAKHADQWSYLIESITGIGTVKAMSIESPVRWRWEGLFVESLLLGQRGARLETAYSALGTFVSTVAATLFLWFGAREVIANAMSVGQLVAFTALAANVVNPVLRLVEAWSQLQDVRNAVDRLNDVFDARPDETAGGALLTLPRIEGRIRFEDVTFRYTPGQDAPTLAGLSFEIPAGATVAVVGRSGSGKSTLAKLILGLYSANKGRVYVDGHDIRTLARRALRRRMGVVPQEVFLFSGTIRENIALGFPDCPFDRVVAAARLAGAHDFIGEMGLGYETRVGERGMSLSGGQRQRIALARALLRDPDVLVLDEATAALDTESERAIQQNLAEASRGRTTIVIAHRLSTVQNATHILVLDRGTLVEEGTHAELLARGGLYAHLVGQQLSL